MITDDDGTTTVDIELESARRFELARLTQLVAASWYHEAIGIFGSYARDDPTDASDLDVIVEFERPIGLFEFVRLENEIGDRLGLDVDLVTKGSLKSRVSANVDEDVVYV